MYLPIRLSLEQSIRHKLLKIVAIIIFLTLLFLGFSIGATFTNQGTISWQGQIDLLTSTTAKLIFAGISVFSILFVIFDNSNFNFLKIQELKSIRSDEISTYERNLEILSIYPLFYDFNLKNELKYKSGILQEIYYSDKETGLICIVVEGITYYFISDYLGFKKAEEINPDNKAAANTDGVSFNLRTPMYGEEQNVFLNKLKKAFKDIDAKFLNSSVIKVYKCSEELMKEIVKKFSNDIDLTKAAELSGLDLESFKRINHHSVNSDSDIGAILKRLNVNVARIGVISFYQKGIK